MERCGLHPPGPGGLTPPRARIGPAPGVRVERAPVRPPRAPRHGRNNEPQQRQPAHPPRAAHYGRAETAVWATWTTGTETPCTGRRTVRAVESRTSPAR